MRTSSVSRRRESSSAPSFPRRRESRMVRCISEPLSRGDVCSLREAASGCAPDRAVPFLCLAKEKEPKERRPCSSVALRATALRCSVFAGRAELTSIAALTAFKQASRSQTLKRAARALQSPALLDDSPRGPRAIRAFAAQTFPVCASLRIGALPPPVRAEVSKPCTACTWLRYLSPNGWGVVVDRECLRSKRPHCSWAPW